MNTTMETPDPWQWHETMRAEGLHVWSIVDGSAGTAPRRRWQGLHGVREINLFAPLTADPQALDIAPCLYASTPDTLNEQRFVGRYAEQSAEQACAAFIATPLSMDELAVRLGRRIRVDAAGLPMILRLWDPRVLRVLQQSLVPDTLPTLLAFGRQALVPDRAGGHETVTLSCPAEDPLAAGQLQLKQQELDALQHAAYPDALLGALREQAEGLIDTVPDEKRHGLARGQWRACEDRRINGVQDHVLALSLAIEHGEDWWTQPRWAVCVQQAEGGSLIDAYRAALGAES